MNWKVYEVSGDDARDVQNRVLAILATVSKYQSKMAKIVYAERGAREIYVPVETAE